MRDKIRRQFHRTASVVGDTPLAQIPGVKSGYEIIDSVLSSDATTERKWIPYDGYDLLVNPSDLVGGRLYEKGYYEKEVSDLITEYCSPGDTVIDIGAHIGHHTLSMRRSVGSSGRALSVEANPQNANLIRETVTENGFENVEVAQTAIGGEAGALTLHIPDDNTGGASEYAESAADTAVEVTVRTLPELLSEYSIDSIDFAKMDIQGTEGSLIPALGDHITKIDTLLLEAHIGGLLPDEEVEPLFSALTEYGEIRRTGGTPIRNIDEFRDGGVQNIIWKRR